MISKARNSAEKGREINKGRRKKRDREKEREVRERNWDTVGLEGLKIKGIAG
jgi:hypothetical protein